MLRCHFTTDISYVSLCSSISTIRLSFAPNFLRIKHLPKITTPQPNCLSTLKTRFPIHPTAANQTIQLRIRSGRENSPRDVRHKLLVLVLSAGRIDEGCNCLLGRSRSVKLPNRLMDLDGELHRFPEGERCNTCGSRHWYWDGGHQFCRRGHRVEVCVLADPPFSVHISSQSAGCYSIRFRRRGVRQHRQGIPKR